MHGRNLTNSSQKELRSEKRVEVRRHATPPTLRWVWVKVHRGACGNFFSRHWCETQKKNVDRVENQAAAWFKSSSPPHIAALQTGVLREQQSSYKTMLVVVGQEKIKIKRRTKADRSLNWIAIAGLSDSPENKMGFLDRCSCVCKPVGAAATVVVVRCVTLTLCRSHIWCR